MPAAFAPVPHLHRTLRGSAQLGRVAPCPFYLVDKGPVGSRLPAGVLDAAASADAMPWHPDPGAGDGGEHLSAAVDDAEFAGPESAADDDADADHLHGDVCEFSRRPFALLLRIECAGSYPTGFS